ncbi:hypothetical protein GCM10019016_023040 [Streptomyces prasinosporus]|uniref:Uncharacterized protein n=1 Tax=Streptomyces prasinosporus TaxID=68256 RepID=A0ABP6TK72_9ACTN|nr:hypothetical protein GCM10010332_06580 [Streptomyces albogriseolus]GHG01460.1 hypothetical protein GCM10018777_10080 [Streptomyces viridodiastaticus]
MRLLADQGQSEQVDQGLLEGLAGDPAGLVRKRAPHDGHEVVFLPVDALVARGRGPRAMPARAALRDHSVKARVPPALRDKPGRRYGGTGRDLQDLPREGWGGL